MVTPDEVRPCASGSYRGTASVGGIRETFSGQFDRLGYAPFVLRRATLSGSLQLDAAGTRVTGFITDDKKSPTLLLYRKTTNSVVPAGNYTMMMAVLPPMPEAGLMMSISPDGETQMRGVLGDGTTVRLKLRFGRRANPALRAAVSSSWCDARLAGCFTLWNGAGDNVLVSPAGLTE